MCLPVKDRGRGVHLTGDGTDASPALSSGLQDLQVIRATSVVLPSFRKALEAHTASFADFCIRLTLPVFKQLGIRACMYGTFGL